MISCEYCRDDNKPLYHVDGPIKRMDSFVRVVDGQIEIDLWDRGNSCATIKINYCPMCGYRLKKDGEAE